jgi:hypothetical protein
MDSKLNELFAAAQSLTEAIESKTGWECTGSGMMLGGPGFGPRDLHFERDGEEFDLSVSILPLDVEYLRSELSDEVYEALSDWYADAFERGVGASPADKMIAKAKGFGK